MVLVLSSLFSFKQFPDDPPPQGRGAGEHFLHSLGRAARPVLSRPGTEQAGLSQVSEIITANSFYLP